MPAGTPPHVSLYVSVANVEQAAVTITDSGGTVLLPPFDVAELGRMATIQDPRGAVVSLWQAKQLIGFVPNTTGEGAPCWFELVTPDIAESREFYVKFLSWTLDVQRVDSFDYGVFTSAGGSVSGMRLITSEAGPVPSHWRAYFGVNSCDAKLAQAKSLGAQILIKDQEMPGVDRVAAFTSPDGITSVITEGPLISVSGPPKSSVSRMFLK